MKIQSYKELIVWQKVIDLVAEIYLITDKFPREEMLGLTSQMRRAAVSIPSNIAEGKARGYRKEFKLFLLHAYGSGAELETQIAIAKKLPKTKNLIFQKVESLLDEIMKMINSLTNKLHLYSET
jgi:four helix bundle protein